MVIFGMVLCVADEHAAGEATPLRSDLQLPSDPHPADSKWDGRCADGRRGNAVQRLASIAAWRGFTILPEDLQGCCVQPAAAFAVSYLLTF